MQVNSLQKFGSFTLDGICLLTLLGIYPRFVEPRLLSTTHLEFKIAERSPSLRGKKILHISDLHFHRKVSNRFLKKIVERVKCLAPDLILFTGDFICFSHLEDPERLSEFLKALQAPLGGYYCFGNHDYASYVTRSSEGNYILCNPIPPMVGLFRGLKLAFRKKTPSKGRVSEEVLKVPFHEPLCDLLKKTPFRLLENESVILPLGLNIVGLGDYGLGRALPEKAFTHYDRSLPGIALAHNPDTFPLLQNYPAEIVLSGHTHGEQIHFAFPPLLRNFSRRLTHIENKELTRGYYRLSNKMLYVNRGLGCHKPMRLGSPPEIMLLTFS